MSAIYGAYTDGTTWVNVKAASAVSQACNGMCPCGIGVSCSFRPSCLLVSLWFLGLIGTVDLVSTWLTRLLALVVQRCVNKRQKGGGRFPIGSRTLRSSTGGVVAPLVPHNSRLEALELDLSVAAAGFAPTRGRPRCLSHVRTRLDRDTRRIFSRSARHLP